MIHYRRNLHSARMNYLPGFFQSKQNCNAKGANVKYSGVSNITLGGTKSLATCNINFDSVSMILEQTSFFTFTTRGLFVDESVF